MGESKTIEIGDAAEFMGVTRQTIRDWIKKGLVPRNVYYRSVGGRFLFYVKDLREWGVSLGMHLDDDDTDTKTKGETDERAAESNPAE